TSTGDSLRLRVDRHDDGVMVLVDIAVERLVGVAADNRALRVRVFAHVVDAHGDCDGCRVALAGRVREYVVARVVRLVALPGMDLQLVVVVVPHRQGLGRRWRTLEVHTAGQAGQCHRVTQRSRYVVVDLEALAVQGFRRSRHRTTYRGGCRGDGADHSAD